jgi:regulator of sigma E protease
MKVLVAILFLGLLMAVHEGGHFLLARLFGMRVLKFSIGFGPVLWSKKPEGSQTTYQIALLPFLAYVQIAGMNPHEEIEADDPESYANASWLGRFLTIIAGPVANYLFAVFLFFMLVFVGGSPDAPGHIDGTHIAGVLPRSPADQANLKSGDEITAIDGKPLADWKALTTEIHAHKNAPITLTVQREGAPVTIRITPTDEGMIGVRPKIIPPSYHRVGIGEAARVAIVQPAKVFGGFVHTFGKLFSGQMKPQLGSVVSVVQESAAELDSGFRDFIETQVILSIYLCVFNLLPFPALDGGRLAFLFYEFVARKRPDAKVEARVHMVGMLALLSLMVPIFAWEIWSLVIGKLFVKS